MTGRHRPHDPFPRYPRAVNSARGKYAWALKRLRAATAALHLNTGTEPRQGAERALAGSPPGLRRMWESAAVKLLDAKGELENARRIHAMAPDDEISHGGTATEPAAPAAHDKP